jgi:L-amino acid N-acyltransferase YncA
VKGLTRSVFATDADAIAGIYEPFVRNTAASFEVEAPTTADMELRIAATPGWLVYESGGSVLGYAYADQLRSRAAYAWSAELSIYVGRASWGRGVGRALLTDLCGFLVAAGFVNAFAGITLPNPRSVGLFESFEFVPCGIQRQVGFKLGAWHDVGWWQRQLRAATNPPPERTA